MEDIYNALDSIGNLNKDSIVNESYFGKNKNLLVGERMLGLLIAKYKVDYSHLDDRSSSNKKLTETDENKKLCSVLKEQFGFKEMYIRWDSTPEENAYTVPGGIILKAIHGGMPIIPIRFTNNTYYDKSHSYICFIAISADLLDFCTAEELMATILHEIGHNFDTTLLHTIMQLVNVYSMSMHLKSLLNRKPGLFNTKYDILWQQIDQVKNLVYSQEYSRFINVKLKIIDEILSHFGLPVKLYYKIWEYFNSNEFSLTIDRMKEIYYGFRKYQEMFHTIKYDIPTRNRMIRAIFGYSEEAFSDSFATAFGYGPATVSLQIKFKNQTRETRILNNSRFLPMKLINDYNSVFFWISWNVNISTPYGSN